MPFWIPVIAAGAGAVLLGKALARHWNGELAHCAVNDPAGVRTVAAFETADTAGVLATVAAELARRIEDPIDVTADAVRARRVDVVRLVRGHRHTLALTRAWTGPQLDGRATELLEHLHAVLARHPAVRALAWHARQDRDLADGYPYPFDP